MNDTGAADATFMRLAHAIIVGDDAGVSNMLAALPGLARIRISVGATRQGANSYFLEDIKHYLYAGDTALHVAAAAYRSTIVAELFAKGADLGAKNRRGAEPLHYAADGIPGSRYWNPDAQAATVTRLLELGADPNAVDKGGVTPLHRAVRARCAAAVKALLDGGADSRAKNKNGSTPMLLATQNTGRGGTGSPEAKAQQQEILRLLEQYSATSR
jgi:hypothetical protein